jgi:hypothetical protein
LRETSNSWILILDFHTEYSPSWYHNHPLLFLSNRIPLQTPKHSLLDTLGSFRNKHKGMPIIQRLPSRTLATCMGHPSHSWGPRFFLANQRWWGHWGAGLDW